MSFLGATTKAQGLLKMTFYLDKSGFKASMKAHATHLSYMLMPLPTRAVMLLQGQVRDHASFHGDKCADIEMEPI